MSLVFLYPGQYGLPFYMQYLAHWPEYFQVAESPSGEIMGYSKYINVLCNKFTIGTIKTP